MTMLDGNTAALNEYLRQQDARDTFRAVVEPQARADVTRLVDDQLAVPARSRAHFYDATEESLTDADVDAIIAAWQTGDRNEGGRLLFRMLDAHREHVIERLLEREIEKRFNEPDTGDY